MKKIIFAVALILTSSAFADQLVIGAASPEQFTYEVTNEGLGLSIVESANHRKTSVTLPYTLSDDQKITIVPDSNSKLKKPLEMLLVVLSYGNTVQEVQVFVPGQTDQMIQSSQTNAVCSFKNFGDFSWETPEQLKKRVELVEGDKGIELRLKIQTLAKNAPLSHAKMHALKCFSIN